jgi:O-antigen ligase
LKIFILAGLVVVASSVIRLPERVEKRFFPKGKFYFAIIQGRYDLQNETGDHSIDSVAHRLMLWKLSLDKWKERPWLGHGPGMSRYLIRNAGEDYASVRSYVDFHNQYFEFFSQLGIIGFTFYALSFFIILHQLFRGKNTSQIPQDYFMFILAAITLFSITCLFGRSFFNYRPIYLVGFLGGMCYSLKFKDYELRETVS